MTVSQGYLIKAISKAFGKAISKAYAFSEAFWQCYFQSFLAMSFPRLLAMSFPKLFGNVIAKAFWQCHFQTFSQKFLANNNKVIPKTPIHYATRGQKVMGFQYIFTNIS